MNVLVKIAVRALEFLFFAGCIGSFLVVLLAGVEDVHSIFERDPVEHEPQ